MFAIPHKLRYIAGMDTTASTYSIYSLCDPITKMIRYIGLSSNPPKRYRHHVRVIPPNGNEYTSHKSQWIRGLRARGLRPIMVIIDEGLDLATATERECDLIAAHSGLVNGTKGGDPNPWNAATPEQKQNMLNSEKHRQARQANLKKGPAAAAKSEKSRAASRQNLEKMNQHNAANGYEVQKQPKNFSGEVRDKLRDNIKNVARINRRKRLAFGDPLQPPLWE